ncbi:hypothetical protein ACM66B_002797 [Microbotryomycetes sp. NB124-2]
MDEGLKRSLEALPLDHQSFNSSFVAQLDHMPTDLEFARFVHTNRPVLIKSTRGRQRKRPGSSAAEHGDDEDSIWFKAIDNWTNEYLCEKLGDKKLNIAVTPDGRADSIVKSKDGSRPMFIEPATVEMTMRQLFTKLDPPHERLDSGPVYYLQSQNGNLGDEYQALRDDVGKDGPEFARRVFGAPPDVSNIWIGDDRSVTSLHKDPYENIYLVVRGSKTFQLLPPTSMTILPEVECQHSTLSFNPTTLQFNPDESPDTKDVRWIDLDLTGQDEYRGVKVLRVEVEQGDLLYLPALWYHQVSQSVGHPPEPSSSTPPFQEEYADVRSKRATIAVNWWYDMSMDAPLWSLMDFVRRCTLNSRGELDDADFCNE